MMGGSGALSRYRIWWVGQVGPFHQDGDAAGPRFSHRTSIDMTSDGPRYTGALVQLTGWLLEFDDEDDHVDHVRVRIADVAYTAVDGRVWFTVEGGWRDGDGNSPYRWTVWYQVVLLGEPQR